MLHYRNSTVSAAPSQSKVATINTLLRQAARYATAAEQDLNPLIAVLHANYGAAYIFALKSVSTDQEVLEATGEDVNRVTGLVLAIQDQAMQKLAKICPQAAPQGQLAIIGGEGATM